VLKLGVVGYSEGNGHPFSFSAIVNGFDDDAMALAGWPVIHGYLRARDPSEFARLNARVVAAYMPDPAMTQKLCAAARIERACASVDDVVAAGVDAVLILRDDAETHAPLALPLLQRGLSVFVDKPLTLSLAELNAFRPFLERGKLMSCAGLRFCRELDEVRGDRASFGNLVCARGAVVLDWHRYGIHMLEAILGATGAVPVGVRPVRHGGGVEHVVVDVDSGAVVDIACLGAVPKTFRVDLFGDKRTGSYDLFDNFTAFSRTLAHFVAMVESGRPSIAPSSTIDVVETILCGRAALRLSRPVRRTELRELAAAGGVA
jgi:hypothetical protein